MRARFVFEKFEEKSDPIKDMGIADPVYRCGWCGRITDKYGNEANDQEFERAKEILDKYGDVFTIKLDGECCGRRLQYKYF